MPIKPRDVVFFYYTGPGYYPDAQSQFPAFWLETGLIQSILGSKPPLSLDEVGDILQSKGARLNVVMADCRDTVEELDELASGTVADEDTRQIFLKKLFLGSCGLVKIASAKKGQRVWATEGSGSVYTENFSSVFKKLLEANFYGVRQATWPQVLGLAMENGTFYKPQGAPIDQTAVIEVKTCSPVQRRNTTAYASYKNALAAGRIRETLASHKANGGNYEQTSGEISRAFLRDAKVVLVRQNNYPASDARARQITERMSIGAYLDHFKNYADRIEHIGTDFDTIKRTPNKEYLTTLTFIKTYDEL